MPSKAPPGRPAAAAAATAIAIGDDGKAECMSCTGRPIWPIMPAAAAAAAAAEDDDDADDDGGGGPLPGGGACDRPLPLLDGGPCCDGGADAEDALLLLLLPMPMPK